jgi:5-formyltetrahydrofolate cyclo-ligase
MDKTALRNQIKQEKRAMTQEQIIAASQRLAQLLYASEAYKKAKSIYG